MKFGDKRGDEFSEEFYDEFDDKFVTNCWGKYSDSPNSVTNLVKKLVPNSVNHQC